MLAYNLCKLQYQNNAAIHNIAKVNCIPQDAYLLVKKMSFALGRRSVLRMKVRP
jgi:hypothetical protein